ncbi:glucose-1-phosphate adenylyltransferase [Paenibacillus castaneae]|uniref:sugar phosphate nucleotidyltransferase n=1 Tax=Paenibacillus castaneae TaxID=474957 RepID=UPI001FB97AA1|nr:sugar phosphate nucleotidyltransferase [Paenibacillus castaneae]NIK77270.1 glucose-1-phosphate adenylyltransferase [Paenibacillus castaneae]
MKNNNTECVAMLLAGGEGRRLSPLTGQMAKPVVPFGDQYRMIDFPLNNCVNSNINKIGVLTQYCADSIHSYINEDQPSLLKSSTTCDITMLPSSNKCKDGYAGTADAIYQNMDYIDRHAPEHVLILSGDHIYQMDYRPMLKFHQESGASATIAVKKVAWREASRFGILNTDDQYRVSSFVEKPAKPQSNLASMGIYLFRWKELKKYLIADAANPSSTHDFGKDIIPAILSSKANMAAYPYEGYWRDVGTIDSLWEANMDLLDGEFKLKVSEGSKDAVKRTALNHYESPYTDIVESILHSASSVEAQVVRSIVCSGVTVGRNSEILESVIMPGARIGRNVTIHRAIIGEGAVIGDGAYIGRLDDEICVVGPGEVVAASSKSMNDYNLEPLSSILSIASDHEHSNSNIG